jgi:hypothetical protein
MFGCLIFDSNIISRKTAIFSRAMPTISSDTPRMDLKYAVVCLSASHFSNENLYHRHIIKQSRHSMVNGQWSMVNALHCTNVERAIHTASMQNACRQQFAALARPCIRTLYHGAQASCSLPKQTLSTSDPIGPDPTLLVPSNQLHYTRIRLYKRSVTPKPRSERAHHADNRGRRRTGCSCDSGLVCSSNCCLLLLLLLMRHDCFALMQVAQSRFVHGVDLRVALRRLLQLVLGRCNAFLHCTNFRLCRYGAIVLHLLQLCLLGGQCTNLCFTLLIKAVQFALQRIDLLMILRNKQLPIKRRLDVSVATRAIGALLCWHSCAWHTSACWRACCSC